MLRTSFRAVSQPLRGHVCLSCRVRRHVAPVTSRQFHFTPVLRTAAKNNESESAQGAAIKDTETSARNTDTVDKKTPSQANQSGTGDATVQQENDSKLQDAESSSNPINEDKRDRQPQKKLEKKAANMERHRQERREIQMRKQELALARKAKKEAKEARAKEAKANPKIKVTAKPGSGLSKVSKILEMPVLEKRSSIKKDASSVSSLSHLQSFVDDKKTGEIDLVNDRVQALDIPQPPVPNLSFGLDRVLFNPGVYQLRDPRSRVYNFDPYLGEIMPVTEFDFNTLKEYITSSRDDTLRDAALKHGKKYAGSSSSMTSVLSHFHYLLSGWRGIDTRMLSQGFPDKMRTFTRLLRSPAAMFLHWRDGTYAIDADKEFDSANILMNLGKSMEKLLTMPKDEFERYRRSHENKITPEEENAVPESYHFSTLGNFIMRSQLDAYDPRLPGTGMFDLKTRAVVSIRMDAQNFEHGLGYEIKERFGDFESYEREYFDMIRAAFLKYSLQVRIGRMDGIFVAFHNIQRIFGFQYVSLPEMDQALHGQSDTTLGDSEFQLSIKLWNTVLDRVTERFPKQSLRLHFETRDAVRPFMYIFAQPVTPNEIKAIQTRNKDKIEAYQQRLLNLNPRDDEPAVTEPKPPSSSIDLENAEDPSSAEILGLALVIKNKVNGKVVDRPENISAKDTWSIEYELNEISSRQAHSLYKMCQKRRQKSMDTSGEDEADIATNVYIRRLRELSKRGRTHRDEQDLLDKEHGIVTYGDPLKS